MTTLLLLNFIFTSSVHVFYAEGLGWLNFSNWVYSVIIDLFFCWRAGSHGDGTLVLALRSDTSTPGCAVLLDQDFTAILIVDQSIVEAIAESRFNLSHPDSVWRHVPDREDDSDEYSSYKTLEVLCEAARVTVFALCLLLILPPATTLVMVCIVVAVVTFLRDPTPRAIMFSRIILPASSFCVLLLDGIPFALSFQLWTHVLFIVLYLLFSTGYKARNHPIRPENFLDALGHPPVNKWKFDTLAAAATFRSLVPCRDISRPIKGIDVPTLLDMLIPDQREVWKAWKERVGDRIMHDVNIHFTPTIPTFWDEWQRQLAELLEQAQSGNDTYRHFYGWHVPLYPPEF